MSLRRYLVPLAFSFSWMSSVLSFVLSPALRGSCTACLLTPATCWLERGLWLMLPFPFLQNPSIILCGTQHAPTRCRMFHKAWFYTSLVLESWLSFGEAAMPQRRIAWRCDQGCESRSCLDCLGLPLPLDPVPFIDFPTWWLRIDRSDCLSVSFAPIPRRIMYERRIHVTAITTRVFVCIEVQAGATHGKCGWR